MIQSLRWNLEASVEGLCDSGGGSVEGGCVLVDCGSDTVQGQRSPPEKSKTAMHCVW